MNRSTLLCLATLLATGCKGNTEMTPGSPTSPSASPATSRATVSPDPAVSGQQGSYQGGAVPAPSGSAVPPASATTAPAATTPPPTTTAPQPRRPKVG